MLSTHSLPWAIAEGWPFSSCIAAVGGTLAFAVPTPGKSSGTFGGTPWTGILAPPGIAAANIVDDSCGTSRNTTREFPP